MNSSSELLISCPVCHSDQLHFALKVEDYSVSREIFDIFECPRCTLRITGNAPADDQIGRYYQSEDYISHSNTRKGIVNGLYHTVRNHTLFTKYRLLKKATGLHRGHHLDIGAGTGAFVQYMNKQGWRSEGVEPDENARACAFSEHKTKLLGAEEFDNYPGESFDAVTMWHVLEHVHDLYPYLHHIKNILKPGGLLFIAVPNYTSYDGQKYGSRWAAYDVPRHLYHFSPASMKWLFKEGGFRLKEMVPMWYDSFYISLLSEKYAAGSIPLLKGFVTGLLSNLKVFSDKEKCSSLIYVAEIA